MVQHNKLKEIIKSAPMQPGVYKILDEKNSVLYIGKAKNLVDRLSSYLRTSELSDRIKLMISQLHKIDLIITASEIDALLLEAQLIKSLKPKYNILLKDDKSQPYITISKHKYPRISKYRGITSSKQQNFYGPFTNARTVKYTILALQKAFLIRSCSDAFFSARSRPCMEYQIRRCSAPCVKKISEFDYAQLVKLAQDTLTGKSKKVQKSLYESMESASKNMKYELAAIYRDRLKALQHIQEQTIASPNIGNADFIGIYTEKNEACINIMLFRNSYCCGSKSYFVKDASLLAEFSTFLMQLYKDDVPDKIYIYNYLTEYNDVSKVLSQLSNHSVKIVTPHLIEEKRLIETSEINAKESLKQKLLNSQQILENLERLMHTFSLKNIPERIEVYDNSHISGDHAIGAMIVCNRNGFLKNEYRKFNIKSTAIGDDYAMMREVITRRFSGTIKEIIPDFMIIDGGISHLTIVTETLKHLQLTIPFVCMAKGPERNASNEDFFAPNRKLLKLAKDSELLLYLQSIRNEAHRFAITTHRQKRNKSLLASQLDKIPGVGPQRRKNLLAYFGSVSAIKTANAGDISKVSGVSTTLAQKIYDYLNKDI